MKIFRLIFIIHGRLNCALWLTQFDAFSFPGFQTFFGPLRNKIPFQFSQGGPAIIEKMVISTLLGRVDIGGKR